jgi:antitoxin HicB
MKTTDYPIKSRPLTEEEGGGYFAEIPDLPGCRSDGKTPQEAVTCVLDAIESWIEAAENLAGPCRARARPPRLRHVMPA